jgi:hypothetical protein
MVSLLAQSPKGKGSGKGKITTKGTRSGVPSTVSESSSNTPTSNLWSPASTTGALGTSPSPFKGKQKGKFTKGKDSHPLHSGASSPNLYVISVTYMGTRSATVARRMHCIILILTNKLVVNSTTGSNW